MKEKFHLLKTQYRNSIVFICKKEKLYTFDNDYIMCKYFNYKKIDYIILNEDYKIIVNCKYNNYQEYYVKSKLIDFLASKKGEIV